MVRKSAKLVQFLPPTYELVQVLENKEKSGIKPDF